MKSLRLLALLSIALLLVALLLAYFQVSNRERQKTELLGEQAQNIIANAKRGEYIATMSGCIACHTHHDNDGEFMAGGVPINTPFGTFYSSNITSDKKAGIGQWSQEEFLQAMSVGRSPDKEHYYPAFPYSAYSVMPVQDLVDLKAWLDSVEPVAATPATHDLTWPFSIRTTTLFWKAMFSNPLRTIAIDERGSYLVNGPGHCAECHAQRNLLGGLSNRTLSGNTRGPDGESVPGITAHDLSGWSVEDIELFLEVGITPEGDFTGGHMSDVIEYSTSGLSAEDRSFIANYLLSDENGQ